MKLENIDKNNVHIVGDGDTYYEMLHYFNEYVMKNSSNKLQILKLPKASIFESIKIINNS